MSRFEYNASPDFFEEPMDIDSNAPEPEPKKPDPKASAQAPASTSGNDEPKAQTDFNSNLKLKPIRIDSCYRHVLGVEYGTYKTKTVPRPYPEAKKGLPPRDEWNGHYVRMPFSPENVFPITLSNGEKKLQKRWDIICEAIRDPIKSSYDLETCIKKYNYSTMDFRGLHRFFDSHLDEEGNESKVFFDRILPEMISLLQRSPSLVTKPLPLLKKQTNCSITLSQLQICALLVNAFFCTFPRRNSAKSRKDRDHEYQNYPDINFNRLFQRFERESQPEKLKCIFNYFKSVLTSDNTPKGLVTFTRRSFENRDMPDWRKKNQILAKVRVSDKGTIEDEEGLLQADFANSFVGGGVLGFGCVQEEIRFVTCPELILARLFTERLEDREVLFVTGFECFSKHKGYASAFQFVGTHKDETPFEETTSGPRRLSYLVAMDAVNFNDPRKQFLRSNINRELNKAFVAFDTNLEIVDNSNRPVAVATGNWGCGAFKGDPQLKSLIQIMAATLHKRDLVYFTFGDKKLSEEISGMYNYLSRLEVTVGDLFQKLVDYGKALETPGYRLALFDFLYQEYESYNKDTDDSEADNKSTKRRRPTDSEKERTDGKLEAQPLPRGAEPHRHSGAETHRHSIGRTQHSQPRDRQRHGNASSTQARPRQGNEGFIVDEDDFPALGQQASHRPSQGEKESRKDKSFHGKKSPAKPSESLDLIKRNYGEAKDVEGSAEISSTGSGASSSAAQEKSLDEKKVKTDVKIDMDRESKQVAEVNTLAKEQEPQESLNEATRVAQKSEDEIPPGGQACSSEGQQTADDSSVAQEIKKDSSAVNKSITTPGNKEGGGQGKPTNRSKSKEPKITDYYSPKAK